MWLCYFTELYNFWSGKIILIKGAHKQIFRCVEHLRNEGVDVTLFFNPENENINIADF